MEDNEQNRNLARQVLEMVDKGCMLQLNEFEVTVAVGYAEMWLDRDMLFFCELGDGDTGKQHVLEFARFDVRSNQVLFYNAKGELSAGLAPFEEWPEVDARGMQAAFQAWKKDDYGLEVCKEVARTWRHAKLSPS